MARPQFLGRLRDQRPAADVMRAEHGYRRRVGLLRLVIPVVVVGIVVALVVWPLVTGGDGAFRLDFADAGFRLDGSDEMLNPRFVGTDSADQPYTVTAEVAMRPQDGGDRIFLMMPKADIALSGGEWMFISADQGVYDRGRETLELEGTVNLFTDTGFEVHTASITFDLRDGNALGKDPVHSQGPWGHLESTGIRYVSAGQVFHFPGRPTLVLFPANGGKEG